MRAQSTAYRRSRCQRASFGSISAAARTISTKVCSPFPSASSTRSASSFSSFVPVSSAALASHCRRVRSATPATAAAARRVCPFSSSATSWSMSSAVRLLGRPVFFLPPAAFEAAGTWRAGAMISVMDFGRPRRSRSPRRLQGLQ